MVSPQPDGFLFAGVVEQEWSNHSAECRAPCFAAFLVELAWNCHREPHHVPVRMLSTYEWQGKERYVRFQCRTTIRLVTGQPLRDIFPPSFHRCVSKSRGQLQGCLKPEDTLLIFSRQHDEIRIEWSIPNLFFRFSSAHARVPLPACQSWSRYYWLASWKLIPDLLLELVLLFAFTVAQCRNQSVVVPNGFLIKRLLQVGERARFRDAHLVTEG